MVNSEQHARFSPEVNLKLGAKIIKKLKGGSKKLEVF
tara:strand:- start:8595 stop:8705 length:111 start_codon:yes stop_codon:yes gene_type:complete